MILLIILCLFPRHRQALDEFQALIRTARKHRIAVIPYSESRRVLEAEELGIMANIARVL